MTEQHGAALEIRDLTVDFGSIAAVRGITLTLQRGERAGLVGESGSGKSVTALSTMRLTQGARTSGRILVGGVDVLALSERRMRAMRGAKIAMVYQDPISSLNPVHTIGRQIIEAITIHQKVTHRAARERAIGLLNEVGVTRASDRMDSYPHEFSGGMRQRVVIAMALAGNPEVLVADEPTTALDVTTQARIIDLLDGIADERGTAILLITHDLGVAAGFCDTIHVMQHGVIVESGPVGGLYAGPRHPYTRRLLGAVVDLATDVTKPIPTGREDVPGGDAVPGHGDDPTGDEPAGTGAVLVTVAVAQAAEPAPGVPEATAGTIIEVGSLVKTFMLGKERIRAVDDVSFTIKKGQTFGLVGESGSGKSTVSRCLLGLAKADSGTLHFDGTDIGSLHRGHMRSLRRRMQMVFQDPFAALNRRQTVLELVTAPLAAHHIGSRSERRETACRMLDLVGMGGEFLHRLPREMSGGQCQRIAIARALVLEPEFLILDEAVSALDVSLQAQVLNLLRDLQIRLGLTYLFVSHDLGVVRYMCSEIAVMRGGRIIETGSREQLFADPREEYTRSLLAAVPIADPTVERCRHQHRKEAVTS